MMPISTNSLFHDDEHPNGELMSDGDNSDTSDSQVTELDDDDFPRSYDEQYETLFHRQQNRPYPLPFDANEFARFRLMHNMLHRLLGAHYLGPVPEVLAPIQGGRKRKVLDLCNGTGEWVMDMATAFPQVKFRGVDFVPIATREPLSNVRFEIHDIYEQLRWQDGDFDFVHARDISMAIRNWPSLINECARLLRSGGLFVSCEWIHLPIVDSNKGLDVNAYAPASVKFFNTIRDILHDTGVSLVGRDLHTHLEGSPHFTNVTQTLRFAPIGQWHDDEMMRSIGNDQKTLLRLFADSVRPMLIRLRMEEPVVQQLIAEFLEEVNTKDDLGCEYVITYARKL